jgi:hypothetical protein
MNHDRCPCYRRDNTWANVVYAWATALCCIHIYIMLSNTNRNIPYLRQETMCSVVVNLRRLRYVVAGSNPLKTTFFAINASGPPAARTSSWASCPPATAPRVLIGLMSTRNSLDVGIFFAVMPREQQQMSSNTCLVCLPRKQHNQ